MTALSLLLLFLGQLINSQIQSFGSAIFNLQIGMHSMTQAPSTFIISGPDIITALARTRSDTH